MPEGIGEGDQDRVSGAVRVGVVDGRELVDVDDEQAGRPVELAGVDGGDLDDAAQSNARFLGVPELVEPQAPGEQQVGVGQLEEAARIAPVDGAVLGFPFEASAAIS